jgi:hypothetical protein
VFSEPTVFVIGAGANSEFGMPLGMGLQKKIGSALDFRRGEDGQLLGDKNLHSLLHDRFKDAVQPHYEAANELSRIIREFPFDSIDEALHWFATSHPEAVALGKAAIVREILAAERATVLFNKDDPDNAPVPESWLNMWMPSFLQMAVASLKKEEIGSAFSKVTIIDFNYDRLIEQFIFSALCTKLNFSHSEATRAISGLHIIRPYGKVGSLPWQKEASAVSFGADIGNDHGKLFSLSENIYTYTEPVAGRVNDDIATALVAARLIVFLGFGFHQQNMKHLKVTDRVGKKHVIATVRNIGPENLDNMRADIFTRLVCTSTPQLLDQTATALLWTMKPTIVNPSL